MNIYLVSYEFPPNIFGGAGSYAESLFKGLVDEGVKVTVVTRGNPNQSTEQVKMIPTPDILYWRRLFFSHYANQYVSKIMEKEDVDIVHYNEPHILLSAPEAPIVSTFHSTQVNELLTKIRYSNIIEARSLVEALVKSPVGVVGDHLAAQKSHRIITPSDDLKRKISKYCNFDVEKIDVIPNGVQIPEMVTSAEEREKYLLYIGRLDPIKGVEYLIQAYSGIRREHEDLSLYIVGTGYYETYLKTIAQQIKGVKFLGHISDDERKSRLYHNCEMLILPSIYEAMPLVVLEAMSYGKPVVASAVGGIPSMIEDGENGYLTEPRNILDLRNKINLLLNCPEHRKQIQNNNRQKIKNRYSIKTMVKNTLKSYEKTQG